MAAIGSCIAGRRCWTNGTAHSLQVTSVDSGTMEEASWRTHHALLLPKEWQRKVVLVAQLLVIILSRCHSCTSMLMALPRQTVRTDTFPKVEVVQAGRDAITWGLTRSPTV